MKKLPTANNFVLQYGQFGNGAKRKIELYTTNVAIKAYFQLLKAVVTAHAGISRFQE